MDFFDEKFHGQLEIVSLFASHKQTLNGALLVIYSNVDGSSLWVKEGDYGFENNPLGLIILERKLIVFVLCGKILENDGLGILKAGLASHALSLVHNYF